MKEREIFQKPQPFDIGRVFDMLMTCINTSDKIAIIWSKKDGIIIHSKMRSKLDQLNCDSAMTIWYIFMHLEEFSYNYFKSLVVQFIPMKWELPRNTFNLIKVNKKRLNIFVNALLNRWYCITCKMKSRIKVMIHF